METVKVISGTEQVIEGHKIVDPSKYRMRVLAIAFLSFLFDAADIQAVSIASPFLIKEWGLQLTQIGVVNTFNLLGTAIGAFIWGPISDRFGRKKALIWCFIWYTLLNLLTIFCTNLLTFSIARLVCGFGLGGTWILGSTYIAEFFETKTRARVGSIVQTSGMFGPMLIMLAAVYLVPIFSWKILFILGCLSVPVILYIIFFIPESPVWLKQKYGLTGKPDGDKDKVEKPKLRELFNQQNVVITVVSTLFGAALLAAYWGANAWIPTYLMTEKGLNLLTMGGYMFTIYAGGLIGYLVFGICCDKFGRRKTFIVGPIITFISTLAFAFALTPQNFLVIAFIYGLLSAGVFGPMGTFIAEQFPTAFRSTGLSFSWGVGHILAAIVPLLVGLTAEKIGLSVCIAIIATAYLLTTLCAVFMKETKNKPLQ